MVECRLQAFCTSCVLWEYALGGDDFVVVVIAAHSSANLARRTSSAMRTGAWRGARSDHKVTLYERMEIAATN